MIPVGLLLGLQLPPGGRMAPDTFELEEIRAAIRHLELVFPGSEEVLDAEVLQELMQRALAGESRNAVAEERAQADTGVRGDTGLPLVVGLPYRPAPHVQFVPPGVVEFEDFLAVLSFMSSSATARVDALRSVLWPNRSPAADAVWQERRRVLGIRLGLREPGG